MKRYLAKGIREFRRLGFKQQESRSTIYDTSSNDQIIKSYKCFGINIPKLKENYLPKKYDVIEKGYEKFIGAYVTRLITIILINRELS